MTSMLLQSTLVFILVCMSFAYAAWSLMPQSWRKGLAQRVRHLPWPGRIQAFWDQASLATAGGGCAGCEKAAPLKAKTVVFFPLKPSSLGSAKAQGQAPSTIKNEFN